MNRLRMSCAFDDNQEMIDTRSIKFEVGNSVESQSDDVMDDLAAESTAAKNLAEVWNLEPVSLYYEICLNMWNKFVKNAPPKVNRTIAKQKKIMNIEINLSV